MESRLQAEQKKVYYNKLQPYCYILTLSSSSSSGAATEATAKGTGEFDVRRGKKEETKNAKSKFLLS